MFGGTRTALSYVSAPPPRVCSVVEFEDGNDNNAQRFFYSRYSTARLLINTAGDVNILLTVTELMYAHAELTALLR